MKTSYKLLILSILIMFCTTAAYDLALVEKYERTNFNDAMRVFTQLKFADFDTIEVNPANLIKTEIVRSDTFGVHLHKSLTDVQVTQVGRKLIVNLSSTRDVPAGYLFEKGLVIKCPILKNLKTDAIYFHNGISKVSRSGSERRFEPGRVTVEGFRQDEFLVNMNNFSTLFLKRNSFAHLNASIGGQDSSKSTIDLDRSNDVRAADFDVQHRSVLRLNDIHIDKFKYKVSDSAEVRLTGISLSLLMNR